MLNGLSIIDVKKLLFEIVTFVSDSSLSDFRILYFFFTRFNTEDRFFGE
jgi:hypothetical protein